MTSIIITGASSGIGRATAELFLREGWRVGLIARRAEVLDEMAAAHKNAVALPADVTDADAMQAAFDRFGDLDVLFNNAGMFGPAGPIDEVALEDWAQVMGVNLNGMFIAARLAFARMRVGLVCYSTTKHAITGLSRSLSLDGRELNVACGQIDIGNAESELVATLKEKQPEMQTMDVGHAAKSVLHMAQLPLEANVQFLTVMATKMPYIGRG